jgi:hypothetical protein
MNKTPCLICFLILILFTTMYSSIYRCDADSAPNLSVEPTSTNVRGGENFTVNVDVADVVDLATWEFKIYFFRQILNAASVTEGSFLRQGGSTAFLIVDFNNGYNATYGRVWLTCTLLGNISGVGGNGSLAAITFLTVHGGNATIHLADTVLGDSEANPVIHTTTDGQVEVTGITNIALKELSASKTIVGKGYPLRVYLTMENQGDLTETLNVTMFANYTLIENKTVSLASHSLTIITFTWNTSDSAFGNFTINAAADILPGETNTTDNTLIYRWIVLTIPGDVNGDGTVDIFDAIVVAGVFSSNPKSSNWDPRADINDDAIVDIYDAILLAGNFGRTAY